MATNHVFFEPPKSLLSILEEDKDLSVPALTKLGCTLGPQSRSVEVLESLLRAGMTVARFDFSWGSMEYHQETLDNLRIAMRNTKRLCCTMLDTMGPEIIVLNRPEAPISLNAGQTLTLTCDKSVAASASVLPISYPSLAGTGLAPGSQVFVGQYLFTGSETSSVYLTVQEVRGDEAICTCNNTCVLEGLALTVHMAHMRNEAPILADSDVAAIRQWGAANKIDYVCLSFTRNAADIAVVRGVLDSCGLEQTRVMAKIENLEGLVHAGDIIEAADSVLLSRGNLGICLDAEKMFLAQKKLLRACNLAGKPVMVTRVVDTMTDAPRPTRAEATDVANLVLDGADGILLGSETFRGKYAVSTVKTVCAICKQAELCFDNQSYYRSLMEYFGCYTLHPNLGKREALASSAVRAAAKINAALIIVFTVTGQTARLVAKYKPACPILTVVCPDIKSDGLKWTLLGEVQARQCMLYRGVLPIMADPDFSLPGGAILDYAIAYAKQVGMVRSGDKVVVSQCPRTGYSDVMEEAGVVKLITVDDHVIPGSAMTFNHPLFVIGSMETLNKQAD
ncbi:hypothetical protein HYH02_010599 [Chlamydomonas schloesseri]|uniref:Pyruvate kinase n=1 Tax=Chlamydomonas schloesseri TaxID=2026947 RepID=A0A835W8H8_9CHLO|nr:hypothetical protein HYH02_010599 [Chlamydomonas schloesseri]|eukprot:KAG2439721.1 hypothetical protein HYH02_010599 [Chlamydomonas schloesseri]